LRIMLDMIGHNQTGINRRNNHNVESYAQS
jgi:hypothetical protein